MYEGEDRLAQAVLGATWQYNYDAANRRVKKIAGSATTNYVWEGKRVIAEYNGVTGALLRGQFSHVADGRSEHPAALWRQLLNLLEEALRLLLLVAGQVLPGFHPAQDAFLLLRR